MTRFRWCASLDQSVPVIGQQLQTAVVEVQLQTQLR